MTKTRESQTTDTTADAGAKVTAGPPVVATARINGEQVLPGTVFVPEEFGLDRAELEGLNAIAPADEADIALFEKQRAQTAANGGAADTLLG
jgi:hypothetical protein